MFKHIKRIMKGLGNSVRAFITDKGWTKVTIAFVLTLVILAGLCFASSPVRAISIGKLSPPIYYYGPGFGYGSTTTIVSTTPSTAITPSEPTSKFTFPWWVWLTVGLLSFSITVLVMWRRGANKH
jgi:hypothetical protein